MDETKPSPQWAIVELFGHQRIAGILSEHTIGGCSFVRVDVPPIERDDGRPPIPGFTKMFGNAAIYAITFVDELLGRASAAEMKTAPVNSWELEAAIKAMPRDRVAALRRYDQPLAADVDTDPADASRPF